jgi:protein TonB
MKREILFSVAGHLVLLAVLGVMTAARVQRDRRRPQVFQVKLVNPGTPVPAKRPDKASVVEPKPKTQPKPRPAEPKPEPKPNPDMVRKRGLGARIEGAQALGYSYYLNIILSRIADNWYNPYTGQARTFLATVYFVIERDGTVGDVKLEKGSGDAAYDLSCTRALLVIERLPPLPPEFTGEQLKLHLEFEYKP